MININVGIDNAKPILK